MSSSMIEFQAVSWIGYDHIDDNGGDQNDDDSNSSPTVGEYQIDIFGKAADGRSVCVHVPFNPYFFVELPAFFTDMHVQTKLLTYLKDRMKGKQLDKHVMAFKLVKRKKFYGFTNNKEFSFACLVFKSIAASHYAASILKKTYTIYENNVDPVLRLMHIRDLRSAGWIRVQNATNVLDKVTRCDVEVKANNKELFPIDREEIGPLVMASFDIECISADGAFPNPEDKDSPVIQIATCFQRYGESEPYKKHIVCLGNTSQIDGVDLVCTDSETEVMLLWSEQLVANKVDVLIGYNIWGFDMEYIYERARFHGGIHCSDIRKFLHNIGKYRFKATELHTMTLSSSAYGNNEWRTMRSPGILQIDLMQVIKKEYKLDSYKLDSVAEHFVGDNKVDLPIPEMFRLYRQGPEEKKKIAEYCVKDTELPLKISQKLAVLPNMVEMAKATHVPLDFLIPRGQQIKVFSQILKKTREKGYVCPSIPLVKSDVKYEGATVLDAKTGAHWGVITCLDFASLYPSIMRAHNMCHSTIVIDKTFDNIDGVNYFEVDGYRFAQTSEGILPEILRDLANFRKKAKKDMAMAKQRNDTFSEMLFNGKQLAFKVSMNSMYGFCGASNGFLPCVPIASCVTNVGRQMISKTKALIEVNYEKSVVVYGDSVANYTPVYIKNPATGLLVICTVESLADRYGNGQWQPCIEVGKQDKEVCIMPPGLMTWTESGWTTLKHVIRHTLAPHKNMVRVLTHNGLVDVTDDHSLLDTSACAITPNEATIGTELLHHDLPSVPDEGIISTIDLVLDRILKGNHTYSVENIMLSGKQVRLAFWKDMIKCSPRDTDGAPYIVCQTHLQAAIVRYLASTLGYSTILETGDDTSIRVKVGKSPDNNNYAIKKMDKLPGYSGYVYDLTTENHHFSAGVGTMVVHNTDSVMIDFGIDDLHKCFQLGEEAAAMVTKTFQAPIELTFEKCYRPYLLFAKKRYAGLYYTNPDKPDKLDCKGIQLVRRDNCKMVKRVLENVLNLIMYERNLEAAVEYVRKTATELLSGSIDYLELVLSKTLKASAVCLKNQRAMTCQKCSAAVNRVGEDILACSTCGHKERLAYKNSTQPHIVVACKQEDRAPGSGPNAGERVPYLYVDPCDKPLKAVTQTSLNAEEVAYVVENKLPIDYWFYLEHQLKKPVVNLMNIVMPDCESKLFTDIGEKAYLAVRTEKVRKSQNATNKQQEITSFFRKA